MAFEGPRPKICALCHTKLPRKSAFADQALRLSRILPSVPCWLPCHDLHVLRGRLRRAVRLDGEAARVHSAPRSIGRRSHGIWLGGAPRAIVRLQLRPVRGSRALDPAQWPAPFYSVCLSGRYPSSMLSGGLNRQLATSTLLLVNFARHSKSG